MSAVLPHYRFGPANYQAATLIYGGQWVQANTTTAGTTDLTVKLAVSASVYTLGVAGTDANVIATQTGAANAYGQPLIDISVLGDYVPVYYGNVDIWCWYMGAVICGQKLIIGATAGFCTGAGASPAADTVVGICTHPGGVSAGMLTQQVGGQGTAAYFLGRARIA
jgi:hypothetical protein